MSQASDSDRPSVTDALFIPAGESRGRMHLQVRGERFVARAVPLLARLGEQVVTRVVLRADGRGFAGILERTPRDGDRLHVGYADAELQPTDVVYRSGRGGSDLPVA
jgi:hypothetical protein